MTDCPFDMILARTPYLVIPKLALQAMPIEWRNRFAALLDEAEATGLETPAYHVFRDDADFTLVERSDSEDEYSHIESVTALQSDPWADYRHKNCGDVKALSPNFKGVSQ